MTTIGMTATEADTLLTAHTTRALYVKLHTGDPGDDGADNASAETTRKLITWDTASGGTVAAVATFPQWTPWAAGAETISHISLWTAATNGTFIRSVGPATTPRPMTDGDTLNLSSLSLSFTPLAS
jgi:hypothetical protein